MRQITLEEWDEWEWIDFTTPADKYPVYIRGMKKTTLPTSPNDGLKYKSIEITELGDIERKYIIIPVMTF